MSTFVSNLVHFAWGTANREPLLHKSWRDKLNAYIGGVLENKKAKLLAAGGVADHIHVLASLPATMSLADAASAMKANSSRWIHLNAPQSKGFDWQKGYGAFSVSKSAEPRVKAYIKNQEEHHRQTELHGRIRSAIGETRYPVRRTVSLDLMRYDTGRGGNISNRQVGVHRAGGPTGNSPARKGREKTAPTLPHRSEGPTLSTLFGIGPPGLARACDDSIPCPHGQGYCISGPVINGKPETWQLGARPMDENPNLAPQAISPDRKTAALGKALSVDHAASECGDCCGLCGSVRTVGLAHIPTAPVSFGTAVLADYPNETDSCPQPPPSAKINRRCARPAWGARVPIPLYPSGLVFAATRLFRHAPKVISTPMKNRRLISLVVCGCVTVAMLARAAISDENKATSATEKPAAPAAKKPATPSTEDAPTEKVTGKEIYMFLCASCHGAKGEGVAEMHDEPLYGDRSIADLTKIIAETMPEDDPGILNDENAKSVAEYIHETFYTADARARNKPPRIELSRLTVSQYLNSVADLIGSFREKATIDDRRGLAGEYYNARNFGRGKKIIDRVDPQIEFDFADKSPSGSIAAEEFSIRWQGSLIVEETGDYEFVVKSQNGVRLWVNDVDKTLIDEWVSSGPQPREHTATIRLLGGRAYPLKLDTFKYKEKSASVALRWRPPHKALETIPARHLTPGIVPETMVVATAFPADDSSTGYPRGTSVSKIWDKATTDAAIEVADYVVEHLDELTGVRRSGERRKGRSPSDEQFNREKRGDNRASEANRKERAMQHCTRLAERAFRRPLTDEQKQFFVDSRFQESSDLDTAVKRSVLLILKSPRFLYPEIDSGPRHYTVASRLGFALWDSLPDDELRSAAAEGRLQTDEQITEHAHRLLANARAKSKVRDFFHQWLPFDEGEEVSKDPQAFPGFDEPLIADLRTSLDMFVDDIVWSEKSDYRQLILANHWFVNQRLAKFYALESPANDGFQQVSLDAKERAGVVTHPYLLSALAYHKSSSPIHRGVFATRKLLGRTLRPPPAAIQFMDGSFDPHMTMREKVTELTKSQACQSCHSVINPLGFSLEHYDAVGRFRTAEKDRPIDATGELTSLDGEVVRLTGARDLAEHAAASDEAHRGFVEQLFQHVVKQPAGAYGSETGDRLVKGFAKSGYNIRKLLVEITKVAVLHNAQPQELATRNDQ